MTQSEMSFASGMESTGTETGPAPGAAGTGGSGKTVLMVVVLLLLISGVVGIYLMTSSPSTNNSGESDDSGGGSGTSGGGVSYGGGTSGGKPPSPPSYVKGDPPSNPPAVPTQPPPPPTRPPNILPLPARAVICTVNGQAVYPSMLPFDPLCDMLIFCHVTLRNADIVGTDNKVSFDTFKKVMAKYETQAGISFDIRYVTAKDLNSTYEPAFDKLVNNSRIVHYGVLDVWASSSDFKNVYEKAKDVLKRLKELQRKDYLRKTIIAMGILNYRDKDADDNLRNVFRDAVTNSVANFVIVMSSFSRPERLQDCYSFPPSIWSTREFSGDTAIMASVIKDLYHFTDLMTAEKLYTTNATMGFSLEFGALGYLLKKAPASGSTGKEVVNVPCKRFFLTSMDSMTCEAGYIKKSVFPGVNVAFAKSDPSYVFLFEDDESLKYKLKKIQDPPSRMRPSTAILLMHVNLGPTALCRDLFTTPFRRVEVVLEQFTLT